MDSNIEIKVRVWLEHNGENILGDGRAELLKKIDELGSISAAARELGMSYRNAWGIIRRLEQRLGFMLVDTHLDKGMGRGARLSPQCRELIKKFDQFRADLDKSIARLQEKHFPESALKENEILKD